MSLKHKKSCKFVFDIPYCQRDISYGRLYHQRDRPFGRDAAAPDLDPTLFVFEDWVLEAIKALQKFIQYCHNGKMLPGWDDFGRLT